jgi:uncharacterized membrane protein YesL
MKILDSRLYRMANTATNYFLLGLLWVVIAIPLVTIFPATVALFGVLRAWREEDREDILGPFFGTFRAKFWQSFLLGFGWLAIGAILGVDILASRRIPSVAAIPVVIGLGLISVLYCQLSVYLFPIIAHMRVGVRGVIRNAFLITLSQPFLSLFAAVGIIIVGIGVYFVPFILLIVVVLIAYGQDTLFRRGVAKFTPGALSGELDIILNVDRDPAEEDGPE